MLRIALLTLACALCAAPALAQRQGDVTIGAGFALGTRSGLELSLRVMAADEVGAVCRVGAIIHYSAWSCGAELYVLPPRRGFLLVEVGRGTAFGHGPRNGAPGSGRHSTLFLNLGGGALVRDTVEYAGASWTGGLGIVLAGKEAAPDSAAQRWRFRPAPSFFVSLMGDVVVNRLGEALREP